MSIPVEQIKEELAAAAEEGERLRLLNVLGLALNRLDPSQALLYAEEARGLALELGDDAARAESLRITAYCHETQSNYGTAMECAREARALFGAVGDRIGEARCLNLIGVINFCTTNYTPALDAMVEARAIFTAEEEQQGIASANNNIGMVHQELGNYPEALAAYLEALRINEELGNEAQAAVNIGNVSNVYYYLGDHERSFEYDRRALEVARRLNNLYSVAHTLESISSNYMERGEYDAALEALNEALGIFREMGQRRYEAAALIKLGTLHELRGEPKTALEQFQTAAKIAGEIGKQDVFVNAQLRIGMLHNARAGYRRAIPVLRKGLAGAREGGMLKAECDLLQVLAGALHGAGEHAEAYTCMKEHAELQAKLYGEEQRRAVAEMQARFEVERAGREREVFRLKSEHLEEMMELRSKELTAMAMRLVQKNAFLQKLRKDMLGLAADNPALKDLLDMLLKAIVENLRGDDEWERFEQEFGLIHHDFLGKLLQKYPRLTPTELKVCAMLKINLSSKEIAGLLSVSLRNVESHRYLIRKKMGLPSDANLTAHLMGL